MTELIEEKYKNCYQTVSRRDLEFFGVNNELIAEFDNALFEYQRLADAVNNHAEIYRNIRPYDIVNYLTIWSHSIEGKYDFNITEYSNISMGGDINYIEYYKIYFDYKIVDNGTRIDQINNQWEDIQFTKKLCEHNTKLLLPTVIEGFDVLPSFYSDAHKEKTLRAKKLLGINKNVQDMTSEEYVEFTNLWKLI